MTQFFQRHKKPIFLFALVFFVSIDSSASDIVEVLPLTNRILMVHFKDGKAIYHKNGEPRDNESIVHDPLNAAQAQRLSSYTFLSANDPNYASEKTPLELSQKTKGQAFAWKCTDYLNSVGCQNLNVTDVALDHWFYLTLPSPMVSGRTYTLKTTLAKNGTLFSLVFDEKNSRSEALHVNQIAYNIDAPQKYGYLYHWMGTKGGLPLSTYAGKPFQLVNTDNNSVVFTGVITFRKAASNVETGQNADTPNANFGGAEVYECNFSAFNAPGNYKLVVPEMGCSFPFAIKQNAYAEPTAFLFKGFYQQRSGIALTAPYTDQPRPAPHHPQLTPGFAGRLKYTTTRLQDLAVADGNNASDKAKLEAGIRGNIDTWGWYQDAGDWDGYLTHTKVPIELMFLFENTPKRFVDSQFNIPESGNGLPDILDEARWLIRFYHRTRAAMKAQGYGAGGVGGSRVAGDWFGEDFPNGKGTGSWQDIGRTWIVSGEDVFVTFRYAGMAAHFAQILATHNLKDPEGIDWKQEAIDCYKWAKDNTRTADFSAPHGLNVYPERLYAAAALYRLTGENTYHDTFIGDVANAKIDGKTAITSSNRLTDEWSYGMHTYLLMPVNRPVKKATLQLLQAANLSSIKPYVETASSRACRWGGDYYMPMLVGQATTPMLNPAILGLMSLKRYDLTTAQNFLPSIQTTADYFLGNNPLNMCWITGLGERSPQEIFCLDSWYLPNYPRKGIVPYGPWISQNSLGVMGPWNNNLPNKTLTPAVDSWPGHERWWNQRNSPLSAEYTVHQSMLWSVIAYGFLSTTNPLENNGLGAYDDTYVEGSTGPEKPLSTGPEEALNGSIIFPNPVVSGSFLTIRKVGHKPDSIYLTDLLGRKTLLWDTKNSQWREAQNGYEVSVKLPKLPSGAYWIELYNRQHEETITQRLVVE
jgi:endoglucanase